MVLSDYKASDWNGLGTVVGGLENYYSMDADPNTAAKAMNGKYFEDAACTQLKPEYQEMTDEDLDQAADYLMLDNHDIYALLSEN
jgi:hypothetical protein